MPPADVRPSRISWPIACTIIGFSIIAVYCLSISLHTVDVETGTVAAAESVKLYREALAGLRDFPYQWRLLGIYLVYAGETLTGLDPHVVDLAVKAALLCVSAFVLFLFSRLYMTEMGALSAVAFYLLLTVAGFTDQYTIYYTNDFALIACWFGVVYCVRLGRYLEAAALTFAGAFAKETMLLAPVLLALRSVRTRSHYGALVASAAAFLVPTVFLRAVYRAPIGDWAWWHMLFANVPFLQSSLRDLTVTLKNNLKVALFFNVFWLLAARYALRCADAFLADLALTGLAYLALAYPVIAIRELRHFLPLAIVVLPLAIAEIERLGLPTSPTRAPGSLPRTRT